MARNSLDSDAELVPPELTPALRPLGTFVATYAPPADEGVVAEEVPRNVRDYLRVLQKHRRLALACFAGTIALTGLITLFTPRRYTASTRLLIARQSPIQLRLADNVRRPEDTDPAQQPIFVATQVAALKSRDLAERVLGHGVATSESFLHPGFRSAPPASVGVDLRPRGWEPPVDAAAQAGGTEDGGPLAHVDPKLIDRYMKYLAVSDVRGTDLIELSFTTPSPELSAFLAARHTQAYMEANEDARRGTDALAASFLDRQLADSRAEVERAEAALAVFAGEHPNVAINEEQKVVAGRITELSSLLTQAEATRAGLESRDEFLTDQSSDHLAYFLDRPGVEKLRLALLDVRAQQAALKPRLGPNHPQMLELKQLEAELSGQLKTEVAQDVRSVRSHYDAARRREEKLRAKLGRQEEVGIELRALGAQYDLLKKDVDTTRKLHTSLLKQRMETKVNSALVPPNVRIIERAEVPYRPSRPKIPLNIVLGLFSGVVIAIGAAFTREYLDASLKSSNEVESILQLPTLAAIPNFSLARQATEGANGQLPARRAGDELFVLHEPWSAVAEAFRSMRTLLFAAASSAGPPKVILVTSARPGEGKTVSSLNLASSLAELGARTLLIDADLRHPRCHTALRIDAEEGLSSWLSGRAELDAMVRTLDIPELFFLPAGPPPRSPADLVASPRMQRALGLLRERFDFIVLDTPPVLTVTDAAALAREVDCVLLVVRGQDTQAEAVRRARDRLVLAGAPFVGVVMNNVGAGWGDPYFYETYYRPGGPYPPTP